MTAKKTEKSRSKGGAEGGLKIPPAPKGRPTKKTARKTGTDAELTKRRDLVEELMVQGYSRAQMMKIIEAAPGIQTVSFRQLDWDIAAVKKRARENPPPDVEERRELLRRRIDDTYRLARTRKRIVRKIDGDGNVRTVEVDDPDTVGMAQAIKLGMELDGAAAPKRLEAEVGGGLSDAIAQVLGGR